MPGMWWNWNGGWAIGMIIMMVVLVGGVVALVVWLASHSARTEGGRRADDQDTPLEIARRRYARGEITKDEFDRLKKDLS